MKKLLSMVLCIIIALVGTASISAAEATTDYSSAKSTVPDSKYDYEIIKTETLPENCVRFYLQGGDIDTDAGINLINETSGQQIKYPLNSTNIVDMYKAGAGEYECEVTLKSDKKLKTGSIGFYVNSTGNTYQLIKVKLTDLASFFNEDASLTREIDGISHNYNFTYEGNGFYSYLSFHSGNAVTIAAPDKDGYISLYVSTKIGDGTTCMADCFMENSKAVSGVYFPMVDFTIGNVNMFYSGVGIDDATAVQKYMSEMITLDSLALRNADVNRDGRIDVDDVTMIQKYAAGFDV